MSGVTRSLFCSEMIVLVASLALRGPFVWPLQIINSIAHLEPKFDGNLADRRSANFILKFLAQKVFFPKMFFNCYTYFCLYFIAHRLDMKSYNSLQGSFKMNFET